MTTITDTETTAVVFDYESHEAEGRQLASAVADAKLALEEDTESAELASELEQELDILNDSNGKITKTRLDAERAVARQDAAKAALSAAERKLGRWNDGEVAELLRPLLAQLANHHPGIAIYTAPIGPDLATLPVPCLLAVQESPTEVGGRVAQPAIDPDGEPGYGQHSARIALTYVYDVGLHRNLLDTGELLRRAGDLQIGIFAQHRHVGIEPVRNLHIAHDSTAGGLATARATFVVQLYPEVPVITNPEIGSLGILLEGQVGRSVRDTGRVLGQTLLTSDIETEIISSRTSKDGTITTIAQARGAVADAYGHTHSSGESWSAYAESAYRAWVGFVDGSLGRCTEVTFRLDGGGYRATLGFVSRRS